MKLGLFEVLSICKLLVGCCVRESAENKLSGMSYTAR